MSFRFTQSITRVFQYYLEIEAARKRVLAQRMTGRCGGICVTIDAYCRVKKIDVEDRDLYTEKGSEILKDHKKLCEDVKVAVWDAVAKLQKLKLAERAKIGTPPAGAQPSSMVDALTLRPYPYEALTGEHELINGADDERMGGKDSTVPRYFDNYVSTDPHLEAGKPRNVEMEKLAGDAAAALDGKSEGKSKSDKDTASPPDETEERQYPDISRKEHYAAATQVLTNSMNSAKNQDKSKKSPLDPRSTPRLLSWIGAVHREATGGIGGVASFSKHMLAVLLAAEDPARVLEIQRQQMSIEEKQFWNRVDVIRKAQQNTIRVPLEKRRQYRDFDYTSSTNRYSPNYEQRSDQTLTQHIGK